MVKSAGTGTEKSNLMKLNLFQFVSFTSFAPFEIYSLFFLSSTEHYRLLLGSLMIVILLLGAVIAPFSGTVTDSFRRKKILEFIIVVWISGALVSFVLWDTFAHYRIFVIMALFVSIDVTVGPYYSAFHALLQNISASGMFARSNGMQEIFGQIPNIAGPLAAIPILGLIGPEYSLIVTAVLATASLLFLNSVTENFAPEQRIGRENEGRTGTLGYLRRYPLQTLLIFLFNFPFILITVGNFINPVFIVSVLHGNTSDISYSEAVYAALASLTGLFLSRFLRGSEMKWIYTFSILYMFGSFMMPLSRVFTIFLIFHSFHGLGNPGTRISRNTLVMKTVRTGEIGRFLGAVSTLSALSRLVLLVAFTLEINVLGPAVLMTVTGIIMLCIIVLSSVILAANRTARSFVDGSQSTPSIAL